MLCKDGSTSLQKKPVPVAISFISLHQYSQEQSLIPLPTFSQMEELIHRRMIWSILQLLNLSCVHSLEIHDSGLLLRHLIFPLQRCHRKNQVLTNGLFDQYNRKACPLSPYSNHEIWQIMKYCITMQEAHPSVSCKVLQTTAVLSPTSWKYRFLIFIRLSRLPACVWPHKLQSFPWRIRIFFRRGGEGGLVPQVDTHVWQLLNLLWTKNWSVH